MFKFCFSNFENSILVESYNCLKENIKFEHVYHCKVQKLNANRLFNKFFALNVREKCLITLNQDFRNLVGKLKRVILDKGLERDGELLFLLQCGLFRVELAICIGFFIEYSNDAEDRVGFVGGDLWLGMYHCNSHAMEFVGDRLLTQDLIEAHQWHEVLMCDLANDDGVQDSHTVCKEQLGPFVVVDRSHCIKFHALCKSTGVWERQDVRVVLDAESLAVKGVLVMLESCRANPHELALSQEPVLQIQNLAVPNLI